MLDTDFFFADDWYLKEEKKPSFLMIPHCLMSKLFRSNLPFGLHHPITCNKYSIFKRNYCLSHKNCTLRIGPWLRFPCLAKSYHISIALPLWRPPWSTSRRAMIPFFLFFHETFCIANTARATCVPSPPTELWIPGSQDIYALKIVCSIDTQLILILKNTWLCKYPKIKIKFCLTR